MDSEVVPSDEIPAEWYRRISGSPANKASRAPRGQFVIRESEPHQTGIPSQQTEGDADENRAGRNNSEKRQNSVVFPQVTLLQPTASNSTESPSDQPAELARERQTENSAFAVPFWIQNSAQTSQINYPTGSSETDASPASIFSNANGSNRHRRHALKKLTQRMTPANGISPQCDPSKNFYNDFSPTPIANESMYHDEHREQWVYDHHYDVPTQRPWVEWGRVFYGDGITPRGKNWFGATNLVRPEFYVYGDFRSGIIAGRNAAGRTDNWANRLNLDMDLKITDTEHLHAFIGPIENEGQFTRLELVDGDLQYRQEIDITPFTGYFEGDLGSILGGLTKQSAPFEFPFTFGLIPLFFQNGIWMEDAVAGAAFSLPARHSNLLNWSNYDATFFAVFDQLNSPAFGTNDHAAQAFGTAWFIEAYHGYIETGYAYVRDRNQSSLSYHNITASYTRRYFDRISNSIRVIINTGQNLPSAERTADGVLLLVENSWITSNPLTVVPYANFFAGWNRPQSVARAGIAGGILRNTGINFDTDGLNGLATLDASGSDTAGGSIGLDLLGRDLEKQLLLEASYLTPNGNGNAAVKGDQYALGLRFQIPLSNSTLWRFDTMYGWRGGLEDVYGTRMEYRWKF